MKQKVMLLIALFFLTKIHFGCNQKNQVNTTKITIEDFYDDEELMDLISELGVLITEINNQIYREEKTYGNLQWETEVIDICARINIVSGLIHSKLNLLETNGIYKVSDELIQNINDSIINKRTLSDVNKNLFILSLFYNDFTNPESGLTPLSEE